MGIWSGIADDTDRCYLGGTPHGLMDVLGLRSTEIDGLFDYGDAEILFRLYANAFFSDMYFDTAKRNL